MSRKVLFLGPVVDGTGNKSTGIRIKNCFDECLLKGLDDFEDVDELDRFVENNKVSCVICLHAFRSGRLLNDGCSVPYGVIFGGTDVNVFSKDERCKLLMTRTLGKSKAIVTFDKNLENTAITIWPEIMKKKIFTIPQGVYCALPEERNLIGKYPSLCGKQILTLVAGLRIEKDPLYLLPAFQEWHDATSNDFVLLVVGPKADNEYSEKFLKEIKKYRSVKYLGKLPQQEVFSILRQSFALVNSSRNEGMSNAILEAMFLEVPIVARDIDGNKTIVDDGHTGLLYDSPQEFISKVAMLRDDPKLKKQLTYEAKQMVTRHHSLETERRQYQELVDYLISN